MTSIPLPPPEIRQGGGPLRNDDSYLLKTAQEDVEMMKGIGLSEAAHILDFGCGPGRIALGLINEGWNGSYTGVEVNQRHVKWAAANLTPLFPSYRFVGVDAPNARYNPKGSDSRRLPLDDGSVDFICAFSVFSHMLADDTLTYLREFRRVLSASGKAYITAYIAQDVPDVTENPEWLGSWKGELHCVLYSDSYLKSLVETSELHLDEVLTRSNRKQTGLLLSAPAAPASGRI